MATTQYIGARYVPLFFINPDDGSNNWKAGVIYDPLTVVTDLNQSYTSKIPVPATIGRPSENSEYWVLTGAYNAQAAQNAQDIIELQEDVNDLQNDVNDLQTAVTNIATHGSMQFNSAGGIGTNYFTRLTKIGDEVFVMAQFSLTSQQQGGTLIYTLPAGWIPSTADQIPVVTVRTSDRTANITQLNVNTDGRITLGAVQQPGEFNIMGMFRL